MVRGIALHKSAGAVSIQSSPFRSRTFVASGGILTRFLWLHPVAFPKGRTRNRSMPGRNPWHSPDNYDVEFESPRSRFGGLQDRAAQAAPSKCVVKTQDFGASGEVERKLRFLHPTDQADVRIENMLQLCLEMLAGPDVEQPIRRGQGVEQGTEDHVVQAPARYSRVAARANRTSGRMPAVRWPAEYSGSRSPRFGPYGRANPDSAPGNPPPAAMPCHCASYGQGWSRPPWHNHFARERWDVRRLEDGNSGRRMLLPGGWSATVDGDALRGGPSCCRASLRGQTAPDHSKAAAHRKEKGAPASPAGMPSAG